MIFTRTYRYQSSMPPEAIKNRLLGKHVTIHKLDFEISENDRQLKIIPHAEQITDIKTLPITHIDFKGNGDKTDIVISSKMRKIDAGGPMMLMIFCAFMLVGALMFFLLGQAEYNYFTYALLSISVIMFAIFWVRLESGYFDYIRKIRDYVKAQS